MLPTLLCGPLGRSRSLRRALLLLSLAGAALAGSLLGAASPQASKDQPTYLGPGSCASSGCHGAVQARAETRVPQNEYSVWVVRDRHSRAFATLGTPASARIARNLGLQRADTAAQCLACHSLDVDPGRRGHAFDLSDGVSCEACHGPAEHWLGPHTVRGWDRALALQQGMYDTKDPVRRAEKCLTCHLGGGDRFVDHELIAAGHPVLVFELQSYTAAMPRHWRQPIEQEPYRDLRFWSLGQAVHLAAAARQLQQRAQGRIWPEYSEYRCEACHHDLTPPQRSWRQERGYAGRRPGAPPWNTGRSALLRPLLRAIEAPGGEQLFAELGRLEAAMSRVRPEPAEAGAAAGAVADSARRLLPALQNARYDRQLALRLLRNIIQDAEYISAHGASGAEQATMTMASLFAAYEREARPANREQVRAALDALFLELKNPSAYHPERFAARLRALGPLLQ